MEIADHITESRRLLATARPEIRALLARVKAEELYPPFLVMVLQALELALADGHTFWVTTAGRSFETQAKLYAYGRTDMSRGVVTKAPPGSSAHEYLVAVDAAYDADPDKAGLQPSWEKPFYKFWADAAVSAGLDAGFYWRNIFDGPHVQLPLYKHGLKVADLKAVHAKGGIAAVFKFLDRFDW